jgi:hypothetical protein
MNRSRSSVCTAGLAALAVLAPAAARGAAASGAAASGAAASGAATSSATPARCPSTAVAPATGSLGKGSVLSGGVVAIRLCRYGALPKESLEATHLTRSSAVIGDLVKRLNALAPVPAGPTACPEDNGSEVALLVGYRSGARATVTAELSGCRIVTRGHVRRSADLGPGGPALLAELVRLTP